MRTGFVFLTALVQSACGAEQHQSLSITLGDPALAITNVSVISMVDPQPWTNHTVIVRGDKITHVGPSDGAPVAANDVQIDGSGMFLIPGLADMHGHVGFDYDPAVAGERADLWLYLATGVTTVRNAAGSPAQLALAKAIDSGELIGPRLVTASVLLEGENAVWSFADKVLTPEEGRAAVRQMAADGYDAVKVYHTIDRETYAAIMDEGRRVGIPVFGHVPFEVGIEEALASDQASIEHFRGYDIDGLTPEILEIDGGRSPERFGSWLAMTDERMDQLVRATVEAGAWNCPTFVVTDMLVRAEQLPEFAAHPMARYMPGDMVARFDSSGLLEIFSPESREMLGRARPQMQKFLVKLHAAGGRLMTGTDTFPSLVPGFTLIDELATFVEAGLSPYDALAAATRDPADYLGSSATRGVIQPGMDADLVLLGANPLEDIENLWQLEGVMADGRWRTREELLDKLAELASAATEAETFLPEN